MEEITELLDATVLATEDNNLTVHNSSIIQFVWTSENANKMCFHYKLYSQILLQTENVAQVTAHFFKQRYNLEAVHNSALLSYCNKLRISTYTT